MPLPAPALRCLMPGPRTRWSRLSEASRVRKGTSWPGTGYENCADPVPPTQGSQFIAGTQLSARFP